jgi:nucleotide-binding universal stress UspA family protein
MGCYRSILVALDGSPDGYAALKHATTLARDQNAPLTLLSVAPPLSTPVSAAPPPCDLYHMHVGVLRAAAASVPMDLGVTTRLERGDPAATIMRIAREEAHDLVVMGSHGHSRIHRALLGSVSEQVLRNSPVPVLLMRAGEQVATAPAG